MENQRARRASASDPSEDDSALPDGGGLLNQAKGFGNAARAARENCVRGEAAERELMHRRNRSGQ